MKVRIAWRPLFGRAKPEDITNDAPSDNGAEDAPPRALVDIHSHILWGLDDGAGDLSETLAMLEMAYAHGTTDIVATPHANYRYRFDKAIIEERIAELRASAPALPRIHAGCDFHLNVQNVDDALAHPHKYAINGLNYVMTEFPDLMIPTSSEEILRRLIEAGMVPVITHPERNANLQNAMQRLSEWVSMGCLIQVTAQSLTGEFGKEAQESAWQMFAAGLVHVVASDAHDTVGRPPRLDAAWAAVKKELGKATAVRVFIHNPSAVITGQPLMRGARRLPVGESAENLSPSDTIRSWGA